MSLSKKKIIGGLITLYLCILVFFSGGPIFLLELEGIVPDRTHANTYGRILGASADIEYGWYQKVCRPNNYAWWSELPILPLVKLNDLYWWNIRWWMQWHEFGNFPPYLRAL